MDKKPDIDPIHDLAIMQVLKNNFSCATCNEILCNTVKGGCCGIKMCRYCYDISLKNQTCPFCRKKCTNYLAYPKADTDIAAGFMKGGPQLQKDRAVFLRNREIVELKYNIKQDRLLSTVVHVQYPAPSGSLPVQHMSKVQNVSNISPLPSESVSERQPPLPSTSKPVDVVQYPPPPGSPPIQQSVSDMLPLPLGSINKLSTSKPVNVVQYPPPPGSPPIQLMSRVQSVTDIFPLVLESTNEGQSPMPSTSNLVDIVQYPPPPGSPPIQNMPMLPLPLELANVGEHPLPSTSNSVDIVQYPPPPGSPPIQNVQSVSAIIPLSTEATEEGQHHLAFPTSKPEKKVKEENSVADQEEIMNYLKAMESYLGDEGPIPLSSNLKSKSFVQKDKQKEGNMKSENDDDLFEYLKDVEHYLKVNPFEAIISGSVAVQTLSMLKTKPLSGSVSSLMEESEDESEFSDIEEQQRLQYLKEVKECMMDNKMKYFVPDSAAKMQLGFSRKDSKSAPPMPKDFEEFRASMEKITQESDAGEPDPSAKLSILLDAMAKSHEQRQTCSLFRK